MTLNVCSNPGKRNIKRLLTRSRSDAQFVKFQLNNICSYCVSTPLSFVCSYTDFKFFMLVLNVHSLQ